MNDPGAIFEMSSTEMGAKSKLNISITQLLHFQCLPFNYRFQWLEILLD